MNGRKNLCFLESGNVHVRILSESYGVCEATESGGRVFEAQAEPGVNFLDDTWW